MASHGHNDLEVKPFQTSAGLRVLIIALIGIGLLTFAAGLFLNKERAWTSYLVSFFYFSCLGLGGLFFTAIQHLTKAGWSSTVRRYSEAMTSFIPFILIGGIVLLLGAKQIFPWMNADIVKASPIIAAKSAYLNLPFFAIRILIFGLAWFAFKWVIVGNSINQDKTGDHNLTLKNVGLSVAFVLFFALSFSFFSVDLLMSLLPSWYSTIFGIYCFSGLFQSTFAVLALILIFIKRAGFVKGYINVEHQHDIAKFMKGFTVFWAYIAFSQFMLIWYANIPEETEYYIIRSQNGWLIISLLLLIFRFIVPFIALLPRGLKRNENHLIAVSVLVLVMQYMDIYWMVYPNFNEGLVRFGIWEIGIFLGFLGLFLFGLTTFFRKFSLVPLKDPRLQEAISHHVTY
ncbi:MAG: molybdopterin oxidoreductase [Bdellovibrionales bacterium]|nr:molybdopterin oxidoreductase [Bdellovibrionales bacterium]